ncbi:MAG: hypothetical protein HW400_596 [Candidatus Levybacteria bacterium]|nr:hypothetical protein [Candidatus Levybacteria bacterium]
MTTGGRNEGDPRGQGIPGPKVDNVITAIHQVTTTDAIIVEQAKGNAGIPLSDTPIKNLETENTKTVEGQPLFLSGITGKPITNETAERRLRKLRKEQRDPKSLERKTKKEAKERKQHISIFVQQIQGVIRQQTQEEKARLETDKLKTGYNETIDIWISTEAEKKTLTDEITNKNEELKNTTTRAETEKGKTEAAEKARLAVEARERETTKLLNDARTEIGKKDGLLITAEAKAKASENAKLAAENKEKATAEQLRIANAQIAEKNKLLTEKAKKGRWMPNWLAAALLAALAVGGASIVAHEISENNNQAIYIPEGADVIINSGK